MAEKLPPRIDLKLLDDAATLLEQGGPGDERVFAAELDETQTAQIMKAIVAQLVEKKIPFSSVEQSMDVTIGDNGASFNGDAEIFVGTLGVKKSMAKVGLEFAMENDPERTRTHDAEGQIKLSGTGGDGKEGAVNFTHLELSGAADRIIRAAKIGPEGTGSSDVVKNLVTNKLRDPNQAFLDVLRGQMAVRHVELSSVGLRFAEGKFHIQARGRKAAGRAA